jgi:hypothetical protein
MAKRQTLRLALRNLANKAYHEHLSEGVSGAEIQAPGRSLQATSEARERPGTWRSHCATIAST